MTINIIDPVLGTGAVTAIGTPVPTNIKRKFTKCAAYNGTGAMVPIKIYLVPNTKAADTSTCYVDYDLQPRETYNCPEIVGAVLGAGGQIEVLGAGVAFSAVSSDTAS